MINGQPFTALNGGPRFQFSEAVSFHLFCETQEEIDRYWEKLAENGGGGSEPCGWLKDKYGVLWQIGPADWVAMMNDPDRRKVERMMAAPFQMEKIDLAALPE